MKTFQNDQPLTLTSTAWVNVLPAVPSLPGGRLIVAQYSAESACYRTDGALLNSYCSIRLLAQNQSTGALVALRPASDADFAFDSTNLGRETSASWQAHAVERAIRLPSAWRLLVQGRIVGTNTQFRLDDANVTVLVAA